MEFVHPLLGVDCDAVSGHYLFTREEILDHPEGKILYFVGVAVTDRSCCGPAGCGYAVVAGSLISYRTGLSHDNRPISYVEPLQERAYQDIAKAIRIKESVSQVHFLLENKGSKVLF